MAHHELKTDPEVFEAVRLGLKNFEIRKDDRGFEVDDTLELRETTCTGYEIASGLPLAYTGRVIHARVKYILRGPVYGLDSGWCILSI